MPSLVRSNQRVKKPCGGQTSWTTGCRDAVQAWRSAGLCDGPAGTDGGANDVGSTPASCNKLRECCQQLGGGTAACLASLSAIEQGSSPEGDCASSLQSFVDASQCSVAGQSGPEMSIVTCSDGIDNDGDGFIDCGNRGTDPDFDCTGGREGTGRSYCGELNCTDGTDNDENGQQDCEDPACASDPACGEENTASRCSDGIDNDGDGYIDCGLHGAEGDRGCTDQFCGEEICDNEHDDDGDGDYDCEDADCDGVSPCGPENTNEARSDGIDNDGDGFIDCHGFTEPDYDCTKTPTVTICPDV